MNYLLDTCVVSEFTKPGPDEGLMAWLTETPESHLFLSAITLGGLQQGISRLATSARRQRLQTWLDDDLRMRFAGRILAMDHETCLIWGNLRAETALRGMTLPVVDAMLASTGLQHRMTLVTRNDRDFAAVNGLLIANPWSDR